MFHIEALVNVQNISHDSVICETRMTFQIHHVAIRQNFACYSSVQTKFVLAVSQVDILLSTTRAGIEKKKYRVN